MFHVKHRSAAACARAFPKSIVFHVKHPDPDAERIEAAIASGATLMGVPLGADGAEKLARHLMTVVRSRGTLNVTSLEDPDRAVLVHVLDSLSAYAAVSAAPQGRIADLGSGGGYPGIPLCVATGRRTVLIESVKKKAEFVSAIVEEIGIDAEIAALRSEELAEAGACGFSCVVARAVAELPALVELAQPLLVDGGLMVAMKGSPGREELERGVAAGRRCGMSFVSCEPAEVPGLHASRTLVVFQREGRSRVALPRRPGMAAKRPLG